MRSFYRAVEPRRCIPAFSRCEGGHLDGELRGEEHRAIHVPGGPVEERCEAPGHDASERLPYRIHLPMDVPANMFWSLTVYDNDTRSMIRNEHGRPLVGSVHGAVANADGSFDLYFGPEMPADVPEDNWVQTTPGKGWFTYLRLYGPELPYFEKTWIPGDAEKVK